MNNNGLNKVSNVANWIGGSLAAAAFAVVTFIFQKYGDVAWNSEIGKLALVGLVIVLLLAATILFVYNALKTQIQKSFQEFKEEINGKVAVLSKKFGALEVDFARLDERVKGFEKFVGQWKVAIDELTHKTDRLLNSAEDLKVKARSLRKEAECFIEETRSKKGSSKAALAKAERFRVKAGELEGQADFLRDTLLNLQSKHTVPQED